MTPLPSPAPLFGDALARVHADGFEDAALKALPALLAGLKKAPPGPMLELGSGAGGLVAHRFSERRGRGRREITRFLRRGKSWMRQHEVHEVVMPTVAQLEQALHRAGLAYRLTARWGRQPLPPRRLAVEAWRRG